MKKIVFGVSIIFVIMFGCTVFAEENMQRSGDILTITPEINEKSINDINNIGLRFCNDGPESAKLTKQLQMQMQPGQRQEICTVFYNRFIDRDIKVNVGFSEGIKRTDGIVSCSQNTSDNAFSRMIQNNTKEYVFTLSGNEQLMKKFKIAVPAAATGIIHGCIAYDLPDNYSKDTGDIFGLLVRKVAPIEIIITGDVYNFGRRDDFKDAYTANKAGILKIVIAILAIRLVVTIFKTNAKKKENHLRYKK